MIRSNLKKDPNEKPTALKFLDYVLLLIVLSMIALRATYIESPHIEQMHTQFFITSEIISLILSTVLLACFAVWLLVSFATGQLRWRKTYLGIPAALFVGAGMISFFFTASNKRMALTDVAFLTTPIITAMLLVQLIKSKQTMRMALMLIVAIGIAATVLCFDQMLASNETIIQDYEQNTAEHLKKAGIEQDSLEHWMYEHRLYSKDIRGFLMTSNSSASFFLLAVFASLGLSIEAFRRRKHPETLAAFACYLLGLAIVLTGLIVTQSKGGIGALIIGIFLLAVFGFFGKKLWKYRVVLGVLLLAGIVIASAAVVMYGVNHGRLPGGNSMLVRWQYWQSASQMISNHPWTGVGGGNFTLFYPQYKTPAALETVQDPHNVVLSLLSQYGPLGLIAFLAAFFIPVGNCLQQQLADSTDAPVTSQAEGKKAWFGLLAAAVCMLVFVRPFLVDAEFLMQRPDVRMAAYVVLYLFPAGVFTLAFCLLCAVSTGDVSVPQRNGYLMIALVCGLVAVLIHNLIDFAIFEPGVWNTFWLFVAILVAAIHNDSAPNENVVTTRPGMRKVLTFALLAVAIVYVLMVIVPPVRASRLFKQALRSENERFELLNKAIAVDPLSPNAAYHSAATLVQIYSQQRPRVKDPSLLEKAADYVDVAQRRNPESFKPFRSTGNIYRLLAGQAKAPDQKADYLHKACDAFSKALDRYPGAGSMHYNLAVLAEELQQSRLALDHYKKAVEIEDAYQVQFGIMYPDHEMVFSRLGNAAYTHAKTRIEELQRPLNKPDEAPKQNQAAD